LNRRPWTAFEAPFQSRRFRVARLPFAPILIVVSLGACLEARPGGAGPNPPGAIEVRLAEEDKAWLAELFSDLHGPTGSETSAREEAARQPAATARPVARGRRAAGPKGADDVQDKMRLVVDGPITSASYNTGAALYQGEQALADGKWVRHGLWRAWHSDGKPWEEGAYHDGEEDGPWRWWYEDGTPLATGTFERGRHVGGWTYYHSSGQVMAEGAYEDDRPVGAWRTYHENGALHSEGRFLNGKRTGRWVVHDPSGQLDAEASGEYRDGQRVRG
jgi:hypothetical protein